MNSQSSVTGTSMPVTALLVFLLLFGVGYVQPGTTDCVGSAGRGTRAGGDGSVARPYLCIGNDHDHSPRGLGTDDDHEGLELRGRSEPGSRDRAKKGRG